MVAPTEPVAGATVNAASSTSLATGSWSPTGGYAYYAFLYCTYDSGPASSPSISHTGMTWTLQGSIVHSTTGVLYVFSGTGSSPSTGTTTATMGGSDTVAVALMRITEASAADATGPVQVSNGVWVNATLVTDTFATATGASNQAIGCQIHASDAATATMDGTEFGTFLTTTTPNWGMRMQYLDSSSITNFAMTWTNARATFGLAVEIQAASGGGSNVGALAGEGGLVGSGLGGGSGILARSMEKIRGVWQPTRKIIRPRLVVPVGIALAGAR